MADAWGGAFGSSWGVSWGSGVTPPTPTERGGDGAPSSGRRKHKTPKRTGRVWAFTYADDKPELERIDTAPQEAVRRPVAASVRADAIELASVLFSRPEAERVAQQLPRFVYAPRGRSIEDEMMARAFARFIEQRLIDEQMALDEEDVELLLLAAL